MTATAGMDDQDRRDWYLYSDHRQQGPYSAAEVRSWIGNGLLSADTWVWRDGMTQWAIIRECEEFVPALEPATAVSADRDGPIVIRFDDVEVRYGKKPALNGLGFDVREGEIFGFIGNNGAGKTTAIHAMLGMIPLSKGSISIFDLNPSREYVKILDQIGFFPERLEPYEWMSLAELFRVGAASYRAWNEELCRQLVTRFGLDLSQRVSTLSKGMVAKTKLIFALSHKPRCLILDEPTEGLDPGSRLELLGILRQLTGEFRMTTIYSSHNLHDVEGIATRVGILHRGALIFDRTTDDIAKRMVSVTWKGAEPDVDGAWKGNIAARQLTPQGPCWLIHDRNADSMTALLAGRSAKDYEVTSPNLETVFMVLTSASERAATAGS